MTVDTILNELKGLGSESTKKVLMKHGAREPFFGVKVEDLKKIAKKTGQQYQLSMDLYRSGNSDAMYLAGIISKPSEMTDADLEEWARGAYWYMLSEYAVAWTVCEHPSAMKLALSWIDCEEESLRCAGWSTLAYLASVKPDAQLDLITFESLLDRVAANIKQTEGRTRYTMNTFLICTGAYIKPLHEKAMSIANQIGKVDYKIHGTACKVPVAVDYITKTIQRNPDFKKKKTARC